jgi:glutamate formiminotransferase / formiminotetrahydrofolate cyclodeaminase
MEAAGNSLTVIMAMVEKGIPGSVPDAAVGALAVRSCIRGAWLNLRVNIAGLEDRDYANDLLAKAEKTEKRSAELETGILQILYDRTGQQV